MKLVAKPRDTRLRFYGPGDPRIRQPGELAIDVADEVLQAMIYQALSSTNYLPLSGGTLTGALTLSNVNIVLGTGAGTKLGTATSQKLAFFNSTPVVQPSSTGEGSGFTAGAGTAVQDVSTFTGNVGSTAYRISDIVKHLKNLGLIAS